MSDAAPPPSPPNAHRPGRRIAVVGAGIAGATLARALHRAGAAVVVFDKSRGVGGRMATRRLAWTDADGRPRTARVDHGAPGFAARGGDFRAFLQDVAADAGLRTWTPRRAADGRRPGEADEPGPRWLPSPDMPALCRAVLQGLDTRLSAPVGRLWRAGAGWRLGVDGAGGAEGAASAEGAEGAEAFDAVLLALPPAQAAGLLAPHRPDWAARASAIDMEPCWTLMGVSRRPVPGPDWALACPAQGPLATVQRADARPGRPAEADEAHWVVHADATWSRRHLEAPPDRVQGDLQAALDALLGERLAWRHAQVHRWRYARPAADAAADVWWDAALGLGACGDAFGPAGDEAAGREGVERAWRSAQALAAAVVSPPGGAGLPAG